MNMYLAFKFTMLWGAIKIENILPNSIMYVYTRSKNQISMTLFVVLMKATMFCFTNGVNNLKIHILE